jgi:hypothetical protein
MGWGFRRSSKVGPFRFTVSKSGVSASVGAGGVRLTSSSRGTFVSVSPGGGLHFRERVSNWPSEPRTPTRSGVEATPMHPIISEEVSEMEDLAAIVAGLNAVHSRGRWLLWAGYVTSLMLLGATGTLAGFGIGAVVIILSHCLRNALRRAALIEIEYLADEDCNRKCEALRAAVDALAKSNRLWQINAFGNTTDWKRNAGANQIIDRSLAQAGFKPPPYLVTNVNTGFVKLKRETLYFLPNILLVHQGGRFGGVAYGTMRAGFQRTSFHEDGETPADSRVLGSTWRYVNKNGGPDRRFSNNRQITVVEYGEAAIASASGLRVGLMSSSVTATDVFVKQLQLLQSLNGIGTSASAASPRTRRTLP